MNLTQKENDAIIAALRLLASDMESKRVLPNDGDIGDILTNGGEHEGLTSEEVDKLAEDFNFGDVEATRNK